MLFDAKEFETGTVLESDVCIIGAGAAGIALGLNLSGQPYRVFILESGGYKANPDTQALYQGENIGQPYHRLDKTRLRFFGGTTNHWTGWCRPPRAHDFQPRDWIPYSGWPLSWQNLEGYFQRAHRLCELGPFEYDSQFWTRGNYQALKLPLSDFTTLVTQFSPPTRFGKLFRRKLVNSPNVNIVLNGNLLQLTPGQHGKSVASAQCSTIEFKRFSIKSRYFILATGGIENARLLLLSQGFHQNGAGNANDLVGRFFMDHSKFKAGILAARGTADLRFYQRHRQQRSQLKGVLGFTESLLARERIGPIHFEFFPVRQRADSPVDEDLRRCQRRFPLATRYWKLYARLDPIPNYNSRISLGKARDRFGLPRPVLDWRFSEFERRTFLIGQRTVAEAFADSGLGRLCLTDYSRHDWPPPPGVGVPTGFHHMGSTRMSSDPATGVVDPDCKVFGIDNLYLAGSSVFPTYEGYPTMSLIALALRLGDHLKQVLSGSSH